LRPLFRAAGLSVVVLACTAAGGVQADPVLLAALSLLAVVSLLARALARRHRLDTRGLGITLFHLLLAALLITCIQRTGGLYSPLMILLAVLVAAAALELAPVANFLHLSGICLLTTFMVVATAEGLVPQSALAASMATGAPAPFVLLLIELGMVGLVGFSLNSLSLRMREQREELACRELLDPDTGTLRQSFFKARLVGLLGSLRTRGVSLVMLDLGLGRTDERMLAEAGALLQEIVRGEDLAGRVGPTHFAAALVTGAADTGERVARRLVAELCRAGCADIRAGVARVEAHEIGDDPVESASDLLAAAEAKLNAERVGFAA